MPRNPPPKLPLDIAQRAAKLVGCGTGAPSFEPWGAPVTAPDRALGRGVEGSSIKDPVFNVYLSQTAGQAFGHGRFQTLGFGLLGARSIGQTQKGAHTGRPLASFLSVPSSPREPGTVVLLRLD